MRRNGLATRLHRLEAAAREAARERFQKAWHAQSSTMAPEHVEIVDGWWRAPEVADDWRDHPDDPWPLRAARLRPPSLARARYELLACHAATGAPLDLRPQVAAVYVEDPQALARAECEDCGYPAPVRFGALGRGRVGPTRYYFPWCPLCRGGPAHLFLVRADDDEPTEDRERRGLGGYAEKVARFEAPGSEPRRIAEALRAVVNADDLMPPESFLEGIPEVARVATWRMERLPEAYACYAELRRRWADEVQEDWPWPDPWWEGGA